jgi:hypothetical protein
MGGFIANAPVIPYVSAVEWLFVGGFYVFRFGLLLLIGHVLALVGKPVFGTLLDATDGTRNSLISDPTVLLSFLAIGVLIGFAFANTAFFNYAFFTLHSPERLNEEVRRRERVRIFPNRQSRIRLLTSPLDGPR